MTRFDAIVIGAGVNGLVAAALLARRGKKVCLLEGARQTGGMAALRPGEGPALAHLVHNLSPAVRRDLGLGRDWPFALTPLATVALAEDGRHVVVDGPNAGLADGTAHPFAAAHAALTERLTRYGALLRNMAETAPPGGGVTGIAMMRQGLRFARTGLSLRAMGKPEMRRFLQVLLSNAYDLILDEMSDGPLAGLWTADAVRGAALGPRSPGTVFSLIYRMGHGGIAARPEGGMEAVIAALEEAGRKAGCTLRTDTRVARILTEGDRVTGVATEAGEILSAPVVLSSAAPLTTARLTGLDHFDIEATRRLRNLRSRGTVAKVNLKLARAPALPGVDLASARMVFAPSAEYVETAFNPSKYGEMSEAPVIEAVMPDPGAASPWLSLLVQYAPADLDGGWTAAARDRLAGIATQTLARALPDLPGLVTSAEVMTPDQIGAATGAPGGHWHQAELTFDQMLTLRPGNGMGHYAFGPSGLYLCGAATHPGGDVMGLSGRNAALRALEDRA